jgi:hypothetical protein
MSSKSRAHLGAPSGETLHHTRSCADNHHSQSKKEFMGMPGFVVDFMSTLPSHARRNSVFVRISH